MTDQELDQAVNAAIDTIAFRDDLKCSLQHFIECAENARNLLERVVNERAGGVAPEDVRQTDRVLKTELMWAKQLLGMIRDHDFDEVRS